MFDPFAIFRRPPRPPLDETARGWVEERLRWLQGEFGDDRLISAPVIEPTGEFFPDPYDGSAGAAQAIMERVCLYMDVPPALVDLRVYDESNRPWLVNASGDLLPGTAGLYQEGEAGFVISLERDQLTHPMELVGTIAHELSHLRLLGENRCDPEAFDNELLTDLTATFFGFGVFLINAPRHWHSDLTCWPGTELRRPEYMTLPMFAYAMAFISELRFEENPKWLCHLSRDARSEYRAALLWLQKRQAPA